MDGIITGFPRQALSRRQKNKEWCKSCVKFADDNTILSSSLIRKTVLHKKINFDLLGGKLDMRDLEMIINPESTDWGKPTGKIEHYPIINSTINLLLGEERASQFDFKVVVTNPNAISEIENNKRDEIVQKMQQLIQDESLSDEEFQQKSESMAKYFTYDWQDIREIRANCLLNHYRKEQNFDELWNDGFADALTVGEEIYQCTIESGEPILKKLDPLKVHVWGAGSSSKIEDADFVVIEDYLPLGKIMDMYYDKLTQPEVRKLENMHWGNTDDHYGDRGDPRYYFRFGDHIDQIIDFQDGWISFNDGVQGSDLPYDLNGNIRVLQVYWKSLRKIKKVKSYDPQTGDTEYSFKTEDYIIDKDKGEEEENLFISQAYHGTMIGSGEEAIYVDMGPCQVQYNTISNPSKCHFGIIGSIYTINDNSPYSMVDMMKPSQYQYDVTKDRLNKLLARNMGKIINLNTSMIPKGWDIDKWLYYVKANGIAVVDPMKEGLEGVAKGKLAGTFNIPATIDTELGNSIQGMINVLEYIKQEMRDFVGITPQRMGQIANRETVGGVERSTLQSSHSTRWFFAKHEDVKKRVCTCFLETAKIAMKGTNKKFQYILPDHSQYLMDIDGDSFAEADYGLVVDNSYDMQALNQEIQQIAQAAMQNNVLTFSTYLKIRSNCSMAEKIKMVENDEQAFQQQQQQMQQQQSQLQEQQIQAQQQQAQLDMQFKQSELQLKDQMNQRDNETKIIVAQMKQYEENDIEGDGIAPEGTTEELAEKIREFDAKLDLDRQKLDLEMKKHSDDVELKKEDIKVKREAIKARPKTNNNK